jgi:hypothetical protein
LPALSHSHRDPPPSSTSSARTRFVRLLVFSSGASYNTPVPVRILLLLLQHAYIQCKANINASFIASPTLLTPGEPLQSSSPAAVAVKNRAVHHSSATTGRAWTCSAGRSTTASLQQVTGIAVLSVLIAVLVKVLSTLGTFRQVCVCVIIRRSLCADVQHCSNRQRHSSTPALLLPVAADAEHWAATHTGIIVGRPSTSRCISPSSIPDSVGLAPAA